MPKRGACSSTMSRSRSSFSAGDQRVDRRAEAERGRPAGTSCTWPSVSMIAPADAIRRHVDERRAERGRTGACRRSLAAELRRPRPRARRACLLRAQPFASAPRAPPRSGRVRSPIVWLGIVSTTTTATALSGSRSSRAATGWRARARRAASASRHSAPRCASTQAEQRQHEADGDRSAAESAAAASGSKATRNQFVLLLPQPFEQSRHVHLVGLVVAGQRVHHEVDAGAVGDSSRCAARRRPSAAAAGRRAASPRRRQNHWR